MFKQSGEQEKELYTELTSLRGALETANLESPEPELAARFETSLAKIRSRPKKSILRVWNRLFFYGSHDLEKIVVIQNTLEMLAHLLYDFIKVASARRGILLYLQYQSVCPLSELGPPTPSNAGEPVSPTWSLGPREGRATLSYG
jgi:hypothetical protein